MALEQGGVKQGSRVYIFRPRVVYGATIHKEQLLKMSRLLIDSKRDELTGEWRKQHNEELDVLYCSRKGDKREMNETGGTRSAYR